MFLTWKRITRSAVTPAFKPKEKLIGYVTSLQRDMCTVPFAARSRQPVSAGTLGSGDAFAKSGRQPPPAGEAAGGMISSLLRAHREAVSGQVVNQLKTLLIFIAVMGI